MIFEDLLSPERSIRVAQGGSKKRTLELIAKTISFSSPELTREDIFDKLTERERLGSTGFGDGIAIPHCRLEACTQATACLLKLDEGIDFDAIDGKKVDLIVALVVPSQATDEHLAILQGLAERLGNADYRQRLRGADTEQLYSLAIASL